MKEITVVGAGIIGICATLSLQEKGFAVTLIDGEQPASGTSYGNAGVISPWTCVPQSTPGIWRKVPRWLLDPEGPIFIRPGYLPRFLPWALRFIRAGKQSLLRDISTAMHALTRPNVALYRSHLQETGHENLVADSVYLHVYRDASKVDVKQIGWQLRQWREVPFEMINGDEAREIEPALTRDIQAAVVIRDQARALDPGKLGTVLYEKAVSQGARFLQRKVHALNSAQDNQWRIETDQETLESNQVLVAAGAWSARLLKPMGITVPLEAERGYHLVARDPGISLNTSVLDVDKMFVASSMLSGVRCAGTDEFAGLDTPPDYRRAQVFKRLLKRTFPDINVSSTEEWMGTRPSFPDSLPCISKVSQHPGLFLAFGHSHYGLGMAPATGNLIAEIINGETPGVDPLPYRLERF